MVLDRTHSGKRLILRSACAARQAAEAARRWLLECGTRRSHVNEWRSAEADGQRSRRTLRTRPDSSPPLTPAWAWAHSNAPRRAPDSPPKTAEDHRTVLLIGRSGPDDPPARRLCGWQLYDQYRGILLADDRRRRILWACRICINFKWTS